MIRLFDGRDEEAIQEARREWKRLKDEGFALSYWREGDDGRMGEGALSAGPAARHALVAAALDADGPQRWDPRASASLICISVASEATDAVFSTRSRLSWKPNCRTATCV